MKRILLCLLLSASCIKPIDEEPTDFMQQDPREDQDQKIQNLEKQLELLKARKSRAKTSMDAVNTKTGRLNFAEYNREDALETQKRNIEDNFLKENWGKEDKAAQEVRNKEGFWVRLTKKTTADSATDSEIEQTRNKRILEINRERIFKDFEIKAKRFQDLKNTYPEFCKKEPWNSLLELGDMNKFVTMSHSDRERLIQQIEDQTQSILEDNFTINADDVPALQDMMRLTSTSQIPEKFQDSFHQTLTSEFFEKTPEEQQKIINQLKIMLKESLIESTAQLKQYNTAMEAIKHDIDSLDHARTMKNVGNAAFWVLGTAAGVCMLGHGALVIDGVSITMEKFAIGAKVGLAAGHIGAHSEAELSKHIQTQFKNIIEPLLPKTTKLLETITYKNQAKSLTERLKEKISKVSNAIKNQFSDETRNMVNDKVNKIKSSISKTVDSGRQSSINKAANKGFDKVSDQVQKGLKTTKETLSSAHDKIIKSAAYKKLSESLSKLKKSLSKNSDNADNKQQSEDDLNKYNEYNLATGNSAKEQS